MLELRADQKLLETVKEFGEQLINKESIENGEAKLKAAGSLADLSLQYVVILGAKSRKIKEIIRRGTEFDQIEESYTQEHNLFIIVKYKELKDEYTMNVSYSNTHGYRIEIPENQKITERK